MSGVPKSVLSFTDSLEGPTEFKKAGTLMTIWFITRKRYRFQSTRQKAHRLSPRETRHEAHVVLSQGSYMDSASMCSRVLLTKEPYPRLSVHNYIGMETPSNLKYSVSSHAHTPRSKMIHHGSRYQANKNRHFP